MLKSITQEQADYLSVLEDNPETKEVLDKIMNDTTMKDLTIKLTDEEKRFISAIINNYQLREELSKLNYNTILDYLQKNGFLNLIVCMKRLSNVLIHSLGENDISRIETIFKYMDYLLHKDNILEVTTGDKLSNDAKDALIEMKRKVYEEELQSIIERLEQARKENEDLLRENSELSSTNHALTQSVEHLRTTRNSLFDENASLRQQIEDNRVILESGLDKEMNAERQRRIGQMDTEVQNLRSAKEKEMANLSLSIQSLKSELAEIDSKFSTYCKDYPIGISQSVEEDEYEVVWEPIADNSKIQNVRLKDLKLYYEVLLRQFKEKIRKTDEEVNFEFESVHSGIKDLLDYCNQDTWTNDYVYSRHNLDCKTLSDLKRLLEEDLNDKALEEARVSNNSDWKKYYRFLKEFRDIYNTIEIPRFIKKEKAITPSYREDIQKLMMVIEAKKQISKAVANQKIAEEALRYALTVFQTYLPEDTRIDFMTALEDGLGTDAKKMVKRLSNPENEEK